MSLLTISRHQVIPSSTDMARAMSLYMNTVLTELKTLPGDRNYKIAIMYADVVNKTDDTEKVVHDIEIIDPNGKRLDVRMADWAKDEYIMERLMEMGLVETEEVEKFHAFQTTIDHLWRQHKVTDSAVFIVTLNYMQLKMLSTL